MRSTELRTWRRSRPLSVLPRPEHSENATFPSALRRDATTCGGAHSISSSPSPLPHARPGLRRALGMSTGAALRPRGAVFRVEP
ncbi:hypothetical protein OPV22_031543 [Ensete ventricosum]|uniref:Uncharacterized protein n=1 Tax=Ensete ventricosum TaxID=4639 RepID=A0AAV8PT09_ENSVE|nr:hypothetical protein OPV22_031543 [Ensete ventricosum]